MNGQKLLNETIEEIMILLTENGPMSIETKEKRIRALLKKLIFMSLQDIAQNYLEE